MAGRGGKGAKRKAKLAATLDPEPDATLDAMLDIPPDIEPETRPEAASDAKPKLRRPYSFLFIATPLAGALLGIGLASYFAASLLGGAVRASARRGAETPAALAATVCGDLIHQNYSDLVGRVDPNPAPPAATGPFDASALTRQLHTLDREGGPVTSCSAAPLAASQITLSPGSDGATRLLLTIWRAGTPLPIASVLITRLSPDGAWVIERDSSFLLAT